jgi:Cytochrome c554 and c-prime
MFVGPHREVDAGFGCVNCHENEFAAWQDTTHNHSLAMPQRALGRDLKRALRIRGSLQRSPLCQNCHFTVLVADGQEQTKYGVSCESCHGAGRQGNTAQSADEGNWVFLHQDQDRWPTADPEARETRMRAAIDAGHIRPAQLYDLASNCFQCHVLAKDLEEDGITLERLVNTTTRAGEHHAPSTPGFELVAFSQGEVRHNFRVERSDPPGQRVDLTNPASDFLRALYIVGKMLDVEFSLRALANATDGEGRFFLGLKARLEGDDGALAKLAEIKDALGDHEVAGHIETLLAAVDMTQVQPNNREALLAMAEQVQEVARYWNGRRPLALIELDETLSAVDPLLPAASTHRGQPYQPR